MGQERPDQRCVEVVEVQQAGLGAGLVGRVLEQQPEGVAVGGDRVRAGVALAHQPVGEERLQARGESGHDSDPVWPARRAAASSINSGAALRYQYVPAGWTCPR